MGEGTSPNAAHSPSEAAALDDPAHRVAAIVTFLVVASGVVILNSGSAFWGLLMGGIVMAWLGWTRRERTRVD